LRRTQTENTRCSSLVRRQKTKLRTGLFDAGNAFRGTIEQLELRHGTALSCAVASEAALGKIQGQGRKLLFFQSWPSFVILYGTQACGVVSVLYCADIV
jgi:hypothetical protein